MQENRIISSVFLKYFISLISFWFKMFQFFQILVNEISKAIVKSIDRDHKVNDSWIFNKAVIIIAN